MKTKSILLILFFALIIKVSFSDNVLIVNSNQTGENQTTTISINMENDSAIVAFQFDIPLPAQLTYVDGSVLLDSSRIVDHTIDAKVLPGDTLRIIGYSLNNNSFIGDTGTIATFQLLTGTVPGNYPLELYNPLLGDTSSTNVLTNSLNGTLSILGPNISISVDSLDFGEVPLLDSTSRSLTINNIGNQDLNVQNITFDTLYFSVVGNSNFTITSGQSQNIIVRFNSVIKGNYNNIMTIISDDYDESSVNVDLNVIAFAVNELHTGDVFVFSGDYATLDFTINNMEPFIGFQFDLIMPSQMSFAPDSAFLSSRMNNHSVSANTLSGNTLRVVAYSENNQWFSGVDGGVLSLGFNIEGIGGYYNLQITNVVIGDTNAENAASDYYNGQLQIAASDISCSNSINFGNVSILGSKQEDLTIYNNGSDTLEISSITFDNSSFSTTASFPLLILPSQNTNISVNFAQSIEGNSQGVMRIWSNDPDEDPYSVNLSGFAFVPNYLSVKDSIFNYRDTVYLELQVTNIESFTGFQFDLDFSDSLSCIIDSIFLFDRAQGHIIQSSLVDTNTLRVFSYSMTQQEFTGNSGSIISIPFIADTNTFGTFSFHLSNAILGNSLSEDILWGTNDGDINIYKPQEIALSAGWNIISFNVEPWYMNMDSILSLQMSSSNLIKVINEGGGFMQNIPGVGWLNTIGNMATTEGYYTKVQNIDTIIINGNIVNNPYTIPLQQGWNIMGYPQYQPDSALSIFQPLISAGTLIKVINESGGFIQYIPGVGWLDYITLLEPGEGYYIKVSINTSIVLDQSNSRVLKQQTFIQEGNNYKRTNIGHPYLPMHIVACFAGGTPLNPGDELGVFINDICIGSAYINDPYSPVVAFLTSDDPTTETIDGGQQGDVMTFKLLHLGSEYELISQNPDDLLYSPLETKLLTFSAIGLINDNDLENSLFVSNVIPNPLARNARFYVNIPEAGNLKIELLDLMGVVVGQLFKGEVEAHNMKFKIEGSSLSQGMYYIKIEYMNDGIIEKVLRKIVISGM